MSLALGMLPACHEGTYSTHEPCSRHAACLPCLAVQVLWYDAPRLRDLVILDPRWVIDAVTCFIRDFKLDDHSSGYARMKDIDQRARREEPQAWSQLTEGSATLSSSLLRLLWSDSEFAAHFDALLDLVTRFGLASPVPIKPGGGSKEEGSFLVPALLRNSPQSAPPAGWPAIRHESATLRVFCHLDGQGPPPGSLTYEVDDLSAGFLPIGAFHRLCAGALGCTQRTATGATASLERNAAWVVFGKEHVLLRYVPEESSILVTLSNDGQNGAAATVTDQLRVLLCEELSSYIHLRHHMLVAMQGSDGWYADLDELPKLDPAAQPHLKVRGETIAADELKSALSLWWTAQCSFYLIDADYIRDSDEQSLPKMLSLQELRSMQPSRVHKELVTMADVIAGKFEEDVLAVSHRWETKEHPDPTGTQLAALRAYLRQHTRIKYVFVDYMCLAQGSNKSAEDKVEFGQMLANINLLYLGCYVLILMDRTYMSRFWTSFEVCLPRLTLTPPFQGCAPFPPSLLALILFLDPARCTPVFSAQQAWLSMRAPTRDGLGVRKISRCDIECMPGVPKTAERLLRDDWRDCNAKQAAEKLRGVDFVVTNQSDKDVQIPKLGQLNEQVRRYVRQNDVQQWPGDKVATASASAPAADDVEGLSALLKETRLADKMKAATAWCNEQGFDAVDEILKTNMDEEFVTALKLKPGKRKLLLTELSRLKVAQ